MNTYPTTKQKVFLEKKNGFFLKDNYRWLEQFHTREMEKWIAAQNTYTDLELERNTDRSTIHTSLEAYTNHSTKEPPVVVNGYTFYTQRKPNQNQPVLYYTAPNAQPLVLIDPNTINPKGTTAIDYWYVSPKAAYIAYALSNDGSETSTIFVLDIKTRNRLLDIIPYVKHSTICWSIDEQSFFYVTDPARILSLKDSATLRQIVYQHHVGTSVTHDSPIFDEHLPKEGWLHISQSTDAQFLFITYSHIDAYDELWVYNTMNKGIRNITNNQKEQLTIKAENENAYIKKSDGTIIRANLTQLPDSFDQWEVVIPKTNDRLEEFYLLHSKLILINRVHNANHVSLYDPAMHTTIPLPLPDTSRVLSITCDRLTDTCYIATTSYLTPSIVYQYSQGICAPYFEEQTAIYPDGYTIEERMYQSSDTSSMPITIISKKGIEKKGTTPALMIPSTPDEIPMNLNLWMPFLEKGGAIALAYIRQSKRNAINDIISAAAYLIQEQYSTSSKLALYANTHTGIYTLEAAIHKANLCTAIVCNRVLTDMLHYSLFYIGEGYRWTHIYGDPADPKEFESLYAISPYHSIRMLTEYPSILFCVGFADSSISPSHAYKMGALLQSLNQQNQIMIRTDLQSGHDNGTSYEKVLAQQTDILAFLFYQLGMI